MKTCLKCGKEFKTYVVIDGVGKTLGGRSYCLDCSPFGKKNRKRLSTKKDKRYCLACGKELSTRRIIKYCNNSCAQKHKWELRKKKFEKTGKFSDTKWDSCLRRYHKRYLFDTRGAICEICKGTTWMGKEIPLVIDHADGNAENWDLSNLRLVCGNCNMQLPTFAGRNYGNGRKWRRDQYKKQKASMAD